MPETPEAFWRRTKDALHAPPVEEWDTWPFEGAVVPRALEPPATEDPPRHGVGGVNCRRCIEGDAGALWSDENWIVRTTAAPTGLPFVAFLETRAHFDFGDLPDELARELGPLLLRVQRAVFSIGDIANVHVCRWGDGSEHCHVWFMARPARLPQLGGSFAAIWDDILPPVPVDVWDANAELVRAALAGS